MRSFMEMIFIDGRDARHTNMSHAEATDSRTWAAFQHYRRYAVDIKQATFLLDYHNRKGDLADTIPVDDAGFKAITSTTPKTAAAYRKIDREYWAEARAEELKRRRAA